MITIPTGQDDTALALLVTDAALPSDKAIALAEELVSDPEGRGYGGKTNAEKLTLLCSPYSKANPTPQERIDKDSLSQAELIVLSTTLSAKRVGMKAANQTVPQIASDIIDDTLPRAAKQDALNLTDSRALALLGILEQTGFLTADEVTALTTIPDPSYQATLYFPARIRTIWGDGLMPTVKDIAEVLG